MTAAGFSARLFTCRGPISGAQERATWRKEVQWQVLVEIELPNGMTCTCQSDMSIRGIVDDEQRVSNIVCHHVGYPYWESIVAYQRDETEFVSTQGPRAMEGKKGRDLGERQMGETERDLDLLCQGTSAPVPWCPGDT